MAAPDEKSVTSNISEIHDLGSTLSVAQRTISSFAHFVPKDIVKGIIDGSISTELGGVRQEVTVLFTDVANFTGIAEASDPDNLMRQMSRHFTALTEAFIAEGGTVDKFIGDSVMVFWNAPHLQLDHVDLFQLHNHITLDGSDSGFTPEIVLGEIVPVGIPQTFSVYVLKNAR